MAESIGSPSTFTPEDLRELQVAIPARIQELSAQPSFAPANLDDAERVAAWFEFLKEIEAKLDAFEGRR